ncbi:MAG TPA: hypothetical protein VMY59_01105 [Candidatus Thermoplasmatota archaeon]|nr:hypothetical protein [Candidatus Thermoplasmatota archaeon]
MQNKERKKKKYKTLRLPEELFDTIQTLIDTLELGYVSPAEYMKDAARVRMREDLQRLQKKKE